MATKRHAKETCTRWDPAENLKSEADIRAYLIASFEEAPDDAAYIAAALGDVARARGMTALAKRTGLTRMGLYRHSRRTATPVSTPCSRYCMPWDCDWPRRRLERRPQSVTTRFFLRPLLGVPADPFGLVGCS